MKVLASDFDGTIFFKDHLKKEDIEAVEAFQKEGHLFGLCTGRPLAGITKYVKDEMKFDFYIISTGAVILDKDLNPLYEKPILKTTVQAIIDKYEGKSMIAIQADRNFYSFHEERLDDKRYFLKTLDDLKTDAIFSISLECQDEIEAKELCQNIKDTFLDVDAFQNTRYIDVVPMGCSKGVAITMLKDMLHIESIAGIGDSYNDIPMLDTVDEAFTFNASPSQVKDHADQCVDSVAQAISILMKK